MMSNSMYDTVQTGFMNGNVETLQKIHNDLLSRINTARKCSVEELLSAMNSAQFTLSRNFCMEHFIPNYAREQGKMSCTAIR